jgi:glycosyltransferase involved in cell wall biosynthesis
VAAIENALSRGSGGVTERAAEAQVTLVATQGSGSLDYYADRLAARLGVERIAVPGCSGTFGHRLVGLRSLRLSVHDVAVLRRLLRGRSGLFHLTSHHLARFGPCLRSPYIVTAHDLIRLRDWRERDRRPPAIHRPTLRDGLVLELDALGLRRAGALIAVSHYTRDELGRHLRVPGERIYVVHEGVDHERFRPVPGRLLDDPYLLFVGSEHPRKNLRTLFLALRELVAEPAGSRLRLVKVGAPGGLEAPYRRQTLELLQAAGIGERVVFTGRIPPRELVAAYAGAVCLVLPSLEEGFGLPVLGAMACGCPVIVADAGSLPEIAGDAALVYRPPADHGALAAAIRRLLGERGVGESLRARGLCRARGFSWERTARETRAVYASLLGEPAERRAGTRPLGPAASEGVA